MPTPFSITHELDCSPPTYWAIALDEAFNLELAQERRYRRRLLKVEVRGGVRVREAEIQPSRELPRWIKSALHFDGLRFLERTVFHEPMGPLEVELSSTTPEGLFSLRAAIAVVPLGPGRCSREYSGQSVVRVPIVGPAAEQQLIDEMRANAEAAVRLMGDWIRLFDVEPPELHSSGEHRLE